MKKNQTFSNSAENLLVPPTAPPGDSFLCGDFAQHEVASGVPYNETASNEALNLANHSHNIQSDQLSHHSDQLNQLAVCSEAVGCSESLNLMAEPRIVDSQDLQREPPSHLNEPLELVSQMPSSVCYVDMQSR